MIESVSRNRANDIWQSDRNIEGLTHANIS